MASRPRYPVIANPGDVLLCEFGPDPRQPGVYPLASGPISLPPEMTKQRHAVVIATPSPGLAIIGSVSV